MGEKGWSAVLSAVVFGVVSGVVSGVERGVVPGVVLETFLHLFLGLEWAVLAAVLGVLGVCWRAGSCLDLGRGTVDNLWKTLFFRPRVGMVEWLGNGLEWFGSYFRGKVSGKVFGDSNEGSALSEKSEWESVFGDSNNYTTIHVECNMNLFPVTRVRARLRGPVRISSDCILVV